MVAGLVVKQIDKHSTAPMLKLGCTGTPVHPGDRLVP
jgi:hypothetical protein